MDYALPRAADMPPVVSELDESQPCTHNPLGAKGCGEAGSIGAPAAIVSAVLDALRPLGVTDLQLPLTPERVWQAIHGQRRRRVRIAPPRASPAKIVCFCEFDAAAFG